MGNVPEIFVDARLRGVITQQKGREGKGRKTRRGI